MFRWADAERYRYTWLQAMVETQAGDGGTAERQLAGRTERCDMSAAGCAAKLPIEASEEMSWGCRR